MRTIELRPQDLYLLLKNKEINLGTTSRSLYLSDNELVMNYEGYGYRPVKIKIDFQYDEELEFTEE